MSDVCPFCSIPPDRVWLEDDVVCAFRDAYPVSEGHTLVVPKAHVAGLYDAPRQTVEAVWRMVGRVREALRRELDPDGFNIGINDGESAGQTVMHAHVHVIPRTSGDVPDPRGGIRWVVPENAVYWRDR